MKNSIVKFYEMQAKLEEMKTSFKMLEAGCEVTLANGEKHTITIRSYDEAIGKNQFYRWNAVFPYKIEHAAMDDGLTIIDVTWNK